MSAVTASRDDSVEPGGALRIAFFVTNFPKLSEIFLLNQAMALQDRGHSVHIYALTDPHEERMQPGSERFTGEALKVAGMPSCMFFRLAELPRLATRNRLRDVLACLNPFREDAEAVTLRHLYRLDSLRDGLPDYDVVHAQLGSVARQCVLLKRLGRIAPPLVTSFRGSDLSRYLTFGMPGAYDGVFREARFCMPVAERWIDPLVRLGCPREKIVHLPSGIPMAQIAQRSLDDWGREDFPRIVSACRLERYKGIQFGLKAFRLLLDKAPRATYDIFGDGPQRDCLARQAKRLGISASVRWHGAARHDEVLAALEKADLHWFTTVTGFDGRTEGLPNILKETQAAGLPVVAFDHPGVDEVVARGETGFIVPEGDVEGLARESLRLLADGDLACRMGTLAQNRAREKYDLEKLTTKLEGVYRAAVAG